MGRMERDKGVRGEREVAIVYRAAGFDLDRAPNSGGLRIKGDLHGDTPEHIEVKRQEVLRIPLWTKQAGADSAGEPWAVVFRTNASEWFAVTTLERHVSLVRCFANAYDGAPANA